MKKIITIAMAVFFCICMMAGSAFAAAPGASKKPVTPGGNRTVDYESVWLNSSASGSFPIYNHNGGTVGITLKVESASDASVANINVKKPDGSYYLNGVAVNPNTNNGNGAVFQLLFAQTGTYTIEYTAYTTVGMRIMCWMYPG